MIRETFKYDFKRGTTIAHSGITNDLDRRENEHQQRWPDGRIVPVGRATTTERARRWERTKHRTITPRRNTRSRSR